MAETMKTQEGDVGTTGTVGCTSLDYRVETVTTLSDLRVLEPEWNRFVNSAETPNVFASFDWFCTWTEQFARERPTGHFHPNVLVVRCGEAIVALAPLVYRKISRMGFSFGVIEFVLSFYSDLLLAEDQCPGAIEAIVKHLTQTADQWDVVSLHAMRNEEEISQIKKALTQTRLRSRVGPEPVGSPYMPLETGTAGILQKLSAHSRGKFRREIDAAKRAGLKVRIVEDPQNEPRLVERMAVVERKKSASRGTAPCISKSPTAFESVISTLGPRGWICVGLMEHGEELISYALTFRCGKKIWYYTIAFDPAFSRFSPGRVLLSHLWDHSFSHGYDEFDFMHGDESYKYRWSTGSHARSHFVIWNHRFTSRAGKWINEDLRPAIESTLERMRARLRQPRGEK